MNDNEEVSNAVDELEQQWISCHLYYHEDLNRVVSGYVQPVVLALVAAAQIDAFFFVRYSLGGPHIRLRLRFLPGFKDEVLTAAQSFAREFLERAPSTKSLDEEFVRRITESILAFDPNETDNTIYPDNSLSIRPFRPEVQRYGGSRRLQASLDFFVLSSVTAVEFLERYGDASRSIQLEIGLCLLLKQAIGFAADETELLDLLRYGMDSWSSGGPPKIIDKADKVFGLQKEAFVQLFRASLGEVRSLLEDGEIASKAVDFLVLGAARLSTAVSGADRPTRSSNWRQSTAYVRNASGNWQCRGGLYQSSPDLDSARAEHDWGGRHFLAWRGDGKRDCGESRRSLEQPSTGCSCRVRRCFQWLQMSLARRGQFIINPGTSTA